MLASLHTFSTSAFRRPDRHDGTTWLYGTARLFILLIAASVSGCAGSGSPTPSDLLANPATYDGKMVTVAGTVTNFMGYVSYDRSNPGVTFGLCAGRSCVHIYVYSDQSYTN